MNSFVVSSAILEKAFANGERVNHLKLQKLLYLANGYHLGRVGTPLIEEKFEAWEFGPTLPSLFEALKQYGSPPLSKDIFALYATPLPAAAQRTVEDVVDTYGHYSDVYLSSLTHKIGTPWDAVRFQGRHAPIPDEVLEDYFLPLAV